MILCSIENLNKSKIDIMCSISQQIWPAEKIKREICLEKINLIAKSRETNSFLWRRKQLEVTSKG